MTDAEHDCLEWQGRIDANGYGKQGKHWAHRLAYEKAVGPIPEGLEIDHLCRNKLCVNPAHLEPVTHVVNCERADLFDVGQANRAKTHCPAGHEYTEANTYAYPRPNGWAKRVCRTCANEKRRAK